MQYDREYVRRRKLDCDACMNLEEEEGKEEEMRLDSGSRIKYWNDNIYRLKIPLLVLDFLML